MVSDMALMVNGWHTFGFKSLQLMLDIAHISPPEGEIVNVPNG
jgi:hypothetical protein